MQPRKHEGRLNEWPPNDFLRQFYGNSGRKWSSIAAAASLPICWDESLAPERERETGPDKEELWLVRLLCSVLPTGWKQRRQSTCMKGIKVLVHLFYVHPRYDPFRP